MPLEEKIEGLIKNFNEEALWDYLSIKDSFEYVGKRYTFKGFEDFFEEINLLAQKRLEDDRSFGVYTIKTFGELSERSSKKRQFELGKRVLRTQNTDAGLFVFYDSNKNFRFSLIHAVYEGKKAVFLGYKRWTYFVQQGKSYRTFLKALEDIKFDTLENILSAFSTKPLVSEFYKEIQNWYAWALKDDRVYFPSGRKEEHLIRLITRLVFVWFLKEKGLIPEKIFEPSELKNIVKDFMRGTNYYNAILQNLFFATLNTEIKKRGFSQNRGYPANIKEFGVKTLYRYQELLNISEEEFIKLFEKTPFINGGLFECLDDDKNYVDGFSREEKYRAKIPDELFFSEERKENLSHFYGINKTATVRGLINILKDYNFTADESTPLDVELSLDPELLGHIFENLLASYNPETQQTARKATGSYYTPMDVVDFMVEVSLLEYLKQKTTIDHKKLEDLVSKEEPVELSEEERRQIVSAVDSVKIIDPAVGSGAFPMRVMHRLVNILEKVDPDNKLWEEKQRQKALEEAEKIFKYENKDIRDELLKELNEDFDTALRYPDYARKLYIVQNSIYGVDIQNIAIQITKLRFFLSLLIDQKVDQSKENFGIKPLPHLETNFVCADTLGKLGQQHKLIPLEIKDLKAELLELYKRHFRIRTRQEKKKIQEKAKSIRERIKEILIKSGWTDEIATKIAEFDIFDQLATADWFDPEWVFGVEDGFDIVIGNPPYIRQEDIKPIKDMLKKNYPEIFNSTSDIYTYFFARGYELLKENGILTYITSNKWLRAGYGEKIRRFFKDNARIEYLIDLGGYDVFKDAKVDTSIIVIRKKKEKNPNIKVAVIKGKSEESLRDLIKHNLFTLHQDKLSYQAYILEDDKVLKLKEKIEKVGKPLKDWDVKIYRGVLTGFNEAFIIDTNTRNEILRNCKDEEERKRTEELIKPCIKGKNIKRYCYDFENSFMIVSRKGIDIENFTAIRNHLEKYYSSLVNRAGSQKWFELQASPSKEKLSLLCKEKIGYSDIGFRFCYVPEEVIGDNTTYFIIPVNDNISLKYMLGVLNSKVSYTYYNLLASKLGGKTSRGFTIYMNLLPIPPITKANQDKVNQIEELVDKILSIKKEQGCEADTSELERQIDQLVYDLYGLTASEIELISKS